MATGLIDIIKRASLDAIENAQLCDLRYGTVTSVSPLKVQITNQFTIPASLLVVPKRLKSEDPLKKSDKVALIRQKGGRSYFILDKI